MEANDGESFVFVIYTNNLLINLNNCLTAVRRMLEVRVFPFHSLREFSPILLLKDNNDRVLKRDKRSCPRKGAAEGQRYHDNWRKKKKRGERGLGQMLALGFRRGPWAY